MEAPPQVQSIISSRDVSTKDALKILKKFLHVQKTFFKEHEHDSMVVDEQEEFIDDGTEHKLGFGESSQRITGMIESLDDGYFQVKIEDNNEEDLAPQSTEALNSSTIDNDSNIEANEKLKELNTKLSQSDDNDGEESSNDISTAADETKSSIDKSRIKESKKDKKDKKKEAKEAKRAMKKAIKEAKRTEKEKQKNLKKERKEKRKREKEEKTKRKRVKAE